MRVLLTEDDKLLADGMITGLKRMGYQVEHCVTAAHTMQALLNSEFSILILDLGLPDGSSVPLIKSLRDNEMGLPILVLTAQDQIETKLTALNNGADDYLVKPIDIRELEARLRVLLRRHNNRRQDVLVSASLSLDLQSHACTVDDQPVSLTRREFVLMKEFMSNPGRVLSREHLEELSYGWEGSNESNALDVHIHNLRKKLPDDTIKTIRGIGFLFSK